MGRNKITVIGVYAPEEGRIEETLTLYDELQTQIDKVDKSNYLIVAGDFNARVGNKEVNKIVGINGEPILNNNGKHLIDFATFNELKIMNTFFRHKSIHKYTWAARGYRSIIDYVLTNKKISNLVQDTRVYRSYDVNSDHFLLISKKIIPYKKPAKKFLPKTPEYTFKVNLLEDISIRNLYRNRIDICQ